MPNVLKRLLFTTELSCYIGGVALALILHGWWAVAAIASLYVLGLVLFKIQQLLF